MCGLFLYLQILKSVGRFVVRLLSRIDSTGPSNLSRDSAVGLFVKSAITNRAMHSSMDIDRKEKKMQAHSSQDSAGMGNVR